MMDGQVMQITKHYIECKYEDFYYFFNFKNNKIIQLNEEEYNNVLNKKIKDMPDDFVRDLSSMGFLVQHNKEDFYDAKKIFMDFYNKSLIRNGSIGSAIFLTDHCNLSCSYCLMKNSLNKKKMDIQTASKIINFIDKIFSSRTKPIPYARFQFTGGEPMLNISTLKYLVIRLSDLFLKNKSKVDFFMTTNGTIDLSEHVDFFNKYNIGIRCTYGKDFDKKFNRNFPNGEDSSKIVRDNIIKLLKSGYEKHVALAVPLWSTELDRDLYPSEAEHIVESIRKDFFEVPKLDNKKITFMFGGHHGNNDGFEIKNCSLIGSLVEEHLQKTYSMPEYREKILNFFFNPIPCCAYREGSVLVFTPSGGVRGLVPAYDCNKFNVGSVDDDVDSIVNNFLRVKESASWMSDDKCISCPILLRCFGACVQKYYFGDKKPSSVCNQEESILKNKLIFNNIIKSRQTISNILDRKNEK